MDVFRGFNEATNTWSSMSSTTDYRERISYDANGNILKYLRNGISSISSNMDSLTYFYYSGTNRLKYVRDNVADNVYTNSSHGVEDINNQTNTSNYTYSEIGNLEKDLKDSIRLIKWNVYGKIVEIQRTASSTRPITNIKYTYDAAGNRISKRVVNNQNNKAEYTWYVRDAQGNVMATYFGTGQASTTLFSCNYNLTVTDQHIYGSSRVGVFNRNFDVKTPYVRPSIIIFERGLKMHELSNHLGNVLVTISDKKIGHNSGNGTIDYYNAEVITANDYYPGGMVMPGRKYPAAGGLYRYGFNGKEKAREITNDDYDFGARIYDGRLGRWLSTDPLQIKYPSLTPYNFSNNSPILFVDRDGREIIISYDDYKKYEKELMSSLKLIGGDEVVITPELNHKGVVQIRITPKEGVELNPDAQRLVKLANSKKEHKITIGKKNSSYPNGPGGIIDKNGKPGLGTGSVIVWNPKSEEGPEEEGEKADGKRAVDIAINHEFIHSEQANDGAIDGNSNTESIYETKSEAKQGEKQILLRNSEVDARRKENQYRKRRGESPRKIGEIKVTITDKTKGD
jgi:RHS repeat-associated protein